VSRNDDRLATAILPLMERDRGRGGLTPVWQCPPWRTQFRREGAALNCGWFRPRTSPEPPLPRKHDQGRFARTSIRWLRFRARQIDLDFRVSLSGFRCPRLQANDHRQSNFLLPLCGQYVHSVVPYPHMFAAGPAFREKPFDRWKVSLLWEIQNVLAPDTETLVHFDCQRFSDPPLMADD
jgi:hypothetical protein